MSYINWDILNKKVLIKSNHGQALIVNINFDDTFKEAGATFVNVLYLATDEFTNLDFTEEESPNLQHYVYTGYWKLDYINSLFGEKH